MLPAIRQAVEVRIVQVRIVRGKGIKIQPCEVGDHATAHNVTGIVPIITVGQILGRDATIIEDEVGR